MKRYFLLVLLLGLLCNSQLTIAQAARDTAVEQKTTPSLAYSQLASEIANLLKRATNLPDEQALSLLRRESPALQIRAKQVKPAYQNWLKTLSVPAQKAEEKRIFSSPWGKYFSDLDPKLGAKIGRNKALGQQVGSLLSLFEGV